MRTLLFLVVLIFSISLYLPAHAQAPLWMDDFGMELSDLTGCDDCLETITFPFAFPYNGNTYNTADVSTNGCIHLNGIGASTTDYWYWHHMDEFLSNSDPDNPIFCPFESDLDLNPGGMIYYNDTNPATITWDGVGAYDDQEVELTFQLQLYSDGRVVINLNGILDQPGESLTDLEEGIIVGLTPSNFAYTEGSPVVPGDPGPVDLNGGPFDFGTTAYERWCLDEANSCGTEGSDTGLPGPPNTAFDLDFTSICFEPIDNGFNITSGIEGEVDFRCGPDIQVPTLSQWGLIATAAILGIAGFMVIRRRQLAA